MGDERSIQVHFRELGDADCPACACKVKVRPGKEGTTEKLDVNRALGEIYALAALSAMVQTFALKEKTHLWVATFCEPHREVMRKLAHTIASGCPDESEMTDAIIETLECTKLVERGAHGTH